MNISFTKLNLRLLVVVLIGFFYSIKSNAQLITVGTGTVVQGTTGATPYGALYEDGRVQYLILKSELTALGITTPGQITSLAFDVTGLPNPSLAGFNIKMAHTNLTTLAGYATGTFTNCFTNSNVAPTLGWNTYAFTSPFVYNNVDNIVVEVCFDNASWATNGTVNSTTTVFNSVYGTFMDGGTGCAGVALTNVTTSTNRPNMRLMFLVSAGSQVLPPIAGIYPSMATPNPTAGMDTVWLNSPQKLVSTSTNAGRSYWDLPNETFLEPGYSRTPVRFTTQEYIDTAKYNQSFTYTFKRRGFWPVRLLAVGVTRPDSLRDSTTRYIFVDTPGTPTVSNFFTPRRKIGFGEYTP
ncbi:MAG: hypothetical protein ACOVO9_01770, partial [Bacteroidia bacterium]